MIIKLKIYRIVAYRVNEMTYKIINALYKKKIIGTKGDAKFVLNQFHYQLT